MKDLILEIGCENLPPASIRAASDQLASDAGALFEEFRLAFDEIYTTGSPRRLVLIARGLAVSQAKRTETITGPPADKAFDEHGKPTQAALGFAKSHGVAVDKLVRIETKRGECVGFSKPLKCERTTVILKRVLPGLITGVKFPKVMRWEETGVRFARPIRWLVCLFGRSLVRFEIAGVRTGNVTFLIPWLRRGRYRVKDAEDYLTTVERAGIVIDHDRRKDTIEKLAKRKADSLGFALVDDPGLVDELTYMLESPHVLAGDFDDRYLSLPPEVVVTAMKAHQRYFALTGKGKRLVPKFLTFTEGKPGSTAVVRRGNEKVLKARLEDALFYWQDDVRTGVDGLAAKLDSIVFIEGLGSLGDKARRMGALGLFVNSMQPETRRVPPAAIKRAAWIAKADLASEMVKDGKEFTKLEGQIGSRYAGEAGEPEDVVAAIREQYLPRSPSDPLPQTSLGALLGIVDRADTISGCFLAGLIPTGSQDPYALRRQAAGLVRILEDNPALSIRPIVGAAVDGYLKAGPEERRETDPAKIVGKIEEFFRVRTETFLKERGIAYDVVAAVAAVSWSEPGVALQRARAIHNLRGDRAFELLITGVKRVGNILAPDLKRFGTSWDVLDEAFVSGPGTAFDPALFEDDSERRLYEAVRGVIPEMIQFDAVSDVSSILAVLSELGPAIDEFFDRVLVNCPDETLRRNRHRFLSAIFSLFAKYADFSLIVEGGESPPG